MRVLLILAVLLGVAYYFFIYRKGQDASTAPATASAPAGSSANPAAGAPVPAADTAGNHGFDGVTAELLQDMNAIPTALDGPGQPPAHARAIKLRLRPYVNLHPEYQVLMQACDLIIRADAQRTTLQESCRAEQSRASFDNALTQDHNPLTQDHSSRSAQSNGHVPTNLLLQTPPPDRGAGAIHQRVETSWNNYRTQAASQVQQLLGSLAGRHL